MVITKGQAEHHFCPYKQCTRAVKKLSQHLIQVHGMSSKSKCFSITKAAPATHKGMVEPHPRPPTKTTITSLFCQGGADDSERDEEDAGTGDSVDDGARVEDAETVDDLGSVGGTEDEGGMSDIGVENKETQQFLPNLEEYLTSRHGKSRSAQEAAAICSEVQKYLHHAGVEGGRKSWSAPAI